jgi:uncharacterized repeat protein (TIGR01451 family)
LMTVPLSYLDNSQVRLMTWSTTTGSIVEDPIYAAGTPINYLIYAAQLPAPPTPTPTPLPTATPPPVLTISKSAPGSAAPGAPITYRLTVANTGGSTAGSVMVSDLLPPAATPAAVSSGGAISVTLPSLRASASWVVGVLAPGAAETVSVTVTASQTLINDTYAAIYGGGVVVGGAAPVLTLVGADTVTGTVDIAAGLVLTSTDGAVVLDLPPSGATSTAGVQLTSTSLQSADFPGPVFEATVTGAGGEPITAFDPPLTVTVTYADADWQNAGIVREEDLNVFFWNGGDWAPVLPCAGCTHDLTRNEFKLRLDHLTLFAVRNRTEVFLPTMLR